MKIAKDCGKGNEQNNVYGHNNDLSKSFNSTIYAR